MKNINNTTCSYMRIGDGQVIPFSETMPDIADGNVKVRYYLNTKLTSLDEEFKDNANVVKVDLSNMDKTNLKSMDEMCSGCVSLTNVTIGKLSSKVTSKDMFRGANKEVAVECDNKDALAYITSYITNGYPVMVSSVEEINAQLALKETNDIVLANDIELSKTISISNKQTNRLNLNNHLIANASTDIIYTEEGKSITSNVDALTVKKGSTLEIVGDGKVTVVSGGGSTLYANGGNIIINGGVYESLQGIEKGKGYSLIYADNEGTVEVNDGYFIVNGNTEEQSYQYVLNCKDNVNSIIKVKGGYYFQWNPLNHDARTKRPNYPEVILGDDFANETYTVEVLENTEFFGHSGTWYHVVPKN